MDSYNNILNKTKSFLDTKINKNNTSTRELKNVSFYKNVICDKTFTSLHCKNFVATSEELT
jgi:hypothetical protein